VWVGTCTPHYSYLKRAIAVIVFLSFSSSFFLFSFHLSEGSWPEVNFSGPSAPFNSFSDVSPSVDFLYQCLFSLVFLLFRLQFGVLSFFLAPHNAYGYLIEQKPLKVTHSKKINLKINSKILILAYIFIQVRQ